MRHQGRKARLAAKYRKPPEESPLEVVKTLAARDLHLWGIFGVFIDLWCGLLAVLAVEVSKVPRAE